MALGGDQEEAEARAGPWAGSRRKTDWGKEARLRWGEARMAGQGDPVAGGATGKARHRLCPQGPRVTTASCGLSSVLLPGPPPQCQG